MNIMNDQVLSGIFFFLVSRENEVALSCPPVCSAWECKRTKFSQGVTSQL